MWLSFLGFFKDKCNACSKSFLANGLAIELREFINVCCQNLLYPQNLQKQAHDKKLKPCSYVLGKKIWFNSKYIKIKKNQKLKAKFFGPFWLLYPIKKQAYKLELPTKWVSHNVFLVSLLKQDFIRKGQINKFPIPEFETGDNKEYEIEAIRNNKVYAKKADGYLSGLYYLVISKGYPKKRIPENLFW